MILEQGYDKGVDWWALGVFIFEMTHGYSPFRAETQAMMFEDILLGRKRFKSTKSLYLRMLLSNILQVEKEHRFGCQQVKDDPWFGNIDWEATFRKEVEAPEIRWNGTSGTRIDYGEEFAELKLEDISEEISKEMYVDDFKDF